MRWKTTALALVACLFSLASGAETIELKDPKGDDKGPGSYTYPTNTVYARGSFDLRKATLTEKGDTIEVKISVNAKVKDPWGSKKWDGNGFSIQMFFLFIDTDHKAGSGHQRGLPGLNVTFADASRWEKALIISPQGTKRLTSEINAKAKKWKKDIVIPTSVSVRGKSVVARFPKAALGNLSKSWGYQVLVQSNEGYCDKADLLTRKVNEYNGDHRFGGGNDYSCDPHVLDMLAGNAAGGDAEAQAQYEQLKTFTCDDENPEGGTHATIKMVYPGG